MPNDESVDNTTNTSFINTRPICCGRQSRFPGQIFTAYHKNMKKFASKIFTQSRPGKLDVEESPRIEGCVNPKIKEKYNITPQNSPVY